MNIKSKEEKYFYCQDRISVIPESVFLREHNLTYANRDRVSTGRWRRTGGVICCNITSAAWNRNVGETKERAVDRSSSRREILRETIREANEKSQVLPSASLLFRFLYT